MEKSKFHFLIQLRPLRVALLLCVLFAIVIRPEIGTPMAYSGWPFVTTLLMPVLAPLFFMLLLLDALMSRVWMSEARGEERKRLRLVVNMDLLAALLLLVFWLPFFFTLGG